MNNSRSATNEVGAGCCAYAQEPVPLVLGRVQPSPLIWAGSNPLPE